MQAISLQTHKIKMSKYYRLTNSKHHQAIAGFSIRWDYLFRGQRE